MVILDDANLTYQARHPLLGLLCFCSIFISTFFLTSAITFFSPLLSSPPPAGTTALHGEVSAMVSISPPGRAVSLHCAPLLGKRDVVLLFPVGDILLNCMWELRSQRVTKLFSSLQIPVCLAKELLQFCLV